MPVRKTETRIPSNLVPADLGEAAIAADGRSALVSYLTSPLSAGRENTYVLFVTDAALASSIASFEWSIDEQGAFPQSVQTDVGQLSYTTSGIGTIAVNVTFLDAGGAELGSVEILQEIGPVNAALETMIADAVEKPGPGGSNLDVIREMVNAYYFYYHAAQLKNPEPGDAFLRYLCGFIFDGVLKRSSSDRAALLDKCSDAIETKAQELAALATQGLGVCGVRLGLLAMTYPSTAPLPSWTELPKDANQNVLADEQLAEKLLGFSEADTIDLFNIVRFPKTNIEQCARIVEALRDKYFAGVTFDAILNGLSGAREQIIRSHYANGPIAM